LKNVFYSTFFKFLAVFFAAVFLLCTAVAAPATLILENSGVYREDYRTPAERSATYATEHNLYLAIRHYLDRNQPAPSEEGFVYCISDRTGTETWKNEGGREAYNVLVYLFVVTKEAEMEYVHFGPAEDLPNADVRFPPEEYEVYRLEGGYLSSSERIVKVLRAEKIVSALQHWRTPLPVIAVAGLILTVFFCVHVCLCAGRKRDGATVELNRADRIPLDLVLTGLFGTGLGLGGLIYILIESVSTVDQLPAVAIFCGTLALIAAILLIWLLYTVAARIKGKTLLRNTVLFRIFDWSCRGIKKLFSTLLRLFRIVPTVPGVATVMGFLALCNILLGLLSHNGGVFLLLFMEWTVLFVAAVLMALGFSYLQKKTKAMARGNLHETVETKYLIGPLKEHAEELNRVEEGLSAAVNERMKSERMKTELITNVSHDIKTPLTSIINYTDLLSKEEGLSPQATEYLNVLRRQTARLKKLTDDVVEVSKASSGALVMEFTPCDLKVLLEQTVGEYKERTDEKNLSVLLNMPETPVTVSADGRRLWRIFDNLMNNVCKYALPGTRVYLTLAREAGQAVITFRNISKDPLNLDPEELTERFVRGDRSRNTEGSGLGLAIARSLTELQQGTFRTETDGDLFKVTIRFPLMSEK